MIKLFYENQYISSWETKIESIEKKDDKYFVVLSETAFYPEGGGQPSDKGLIDGIEVLDLLEENGIIYHILKKIPDKKYVKCSIDFSRRFDYMQQHSGQHILSSFFYKLYNGRTAGFHLGEEYVTIDIALPEISDEMLIEVENCVNENIYKNHEIKTYFVNHDEALSHPLRRLPPNKENIRIVEIEDTDCTPCCGTHVKSTGEIGIVKILKSEKYKGMNRIYFKCGKRAFNDFQNKHQIISTLNNMLSTDEREIIERLKLKEQQIQKLSADIKNLKEILINFEVSNILESTKDIIITKVYDDKDFDEIQRIAKNLLQRGNYIIIFSTKLDKRILFCSSEGFSINCGLLFKENLKNYNGKGGGGERQAQAGFNNIDDMIAFHKFIHLTISTLLKNKS
ncbi:alanyl-tRNA synthetase [Caloramator quimbayensis]|uniref:Alanyl-tRNA synthetase n=2 Tax=Caloramator quimbayensis TaxID=1147123 RepID=A0A1T4WR76_9CLOT|nr:alanyl-tRNA synthetase [Caloramator quimbayensis]